MPKKPSASTKLVTTRSKRRTPSPLPTEFKTAADYVDYAIRAANRGKKHQPSPKTVISHLDEGIRNHPNEDPRLYRQFAQWCMRIEGQTYDDYAEWGLEAAYELNNDDVSLLYELGALMSQHGHFEAAEECYAEIVLIQEKMDGKVLLALGQNYEAQSEFGLAAAAYKLGINHTKVGKSEVIKPHATLQEGLERMREHVSERHDKSNKRDLKARINALRKEMEYADLEPITGIAPGQFVNFDAA